MSIDIDEGASADWIKIAERARRLKLTHSKSFDVIKAESDFTDEERAYATKWIEKAQVLKKAGKRASAAG